ncbi:MAG: hypothetical protein TR69_WS6001000598 [candidate division WS6 bacterium OLB20]|uniref:VanZ-like domain-containing protein n=1 Tax=candidate division WS6 bacterium OLB20 TaxID=1617426 RepID=A0A136LY49_9BACT|nr:MAG: hypothetical protein TR69_WS6001000598 [candidate division WS6 bacterium OLB20]
MMSQRVFILYTWLTAAAWYGFILLLSMVPDLDVTGTQTDWLVRSLGYALMYGLLFLLLFRALLGTVRMRIERLRYYKSRRERAEDNEFAYLTEFLLFIIAVLFTLLLSGLDEYLQTGVRGRVGAVIDVIVNLLGIIVTAVIAFKVPVVTELEELLFKNETEARRTRSKKS